MDVSIALNNDDDDEFVTRTTSSFSVLPQSREFNVNLLLFSVLLRVKCVCVCVCVFNVISLYGVVRGVGWDLTDTKFTF